jgi:hypothetical protein
MKHRITKIFGSVASIAALIVGAAAVNVAALPGTASAGSCTDVTLYNSPFSELTAALKWSPSEPTQTVQYLPAGQWIQACPVFYYFYVHSGKNVRLTGNFIVGNGQTENYEYEETGWHVFPLQYRAGNTSVDYYER